MGPEEAARLLREELEECLADLAGPAPHPTVGLQPPEELRPDTSFRVRVGSVAGGTIESELPVNLALGYLADEEAAVDEWRLWVEVLWKRLAGPPDSA